MVRSTITMITVYLYSGLSMQSTQEHWSDDLADF